MNPDSRYHQSSFAAIKGRGGHFCGQCVSFKLCVAKKNVKAFTEYCQYPPHIRKFEKEVDQYKRIYGTGTPII